MIRRYQRPDDPPAPRWALRIFPEGGTLYVAVNVWETVEELRHRWHAVGNSTDAEDCQAFCSEQLRWKVPAVGRVRRRPIVAEVNFWRGRVGTEVVAHEMFHATLCWMRRLRIGGATLDGLAEGELVSDAEERLAYVHGRLCKEFVRVAHDVGLYDPERNPQGEAIAA